MPFGVRVYPEGEVASVYEGLVVVAPVGGAILFLVGSSSLWFHCFIVANLGAYATRPFIVANLEAYATRPVCDSLLNKSSFISLNGIVNRIVSVLFRLDYSVQLIVQFILY